MKVFRFSRLIGFVAGIVMIIIFKDSFVNNLKWFIGGLMILYGVLGIVNIILEKETQIHIRHDFLFNAVEILIGAAILIFIKEFSTVCVVWAVWSILRESIELKEIVSGELHPVLAVISGIESIALIVLSIMLMAETNEHHALVHTYFLCVELFLTSSIPIVNSYLRKPHEKAHKESEKDVVTETEDKAENSTETSEPEAFAEENEDSCKVT